MFTDRIEAGFALAEKLQQYKNAEGVVLAVPKGGVPIGYMVAAQLGLPLELVLSKKIGHPQNKEYAIGAVSLLGSFIVPHKDVPDGYIERETKRIREYLQEMQHKFMEGHEHTDLHNKTVIVIDDGIATGNTLFAIVNILKQHKPAKIIIAVPVSSRAGYDMLSKHVDEMVAILRPEYFAGVGAYYEDFGDVSEEQVKYYLDKAREQRLVQKK